MKDILKNIEKLYKEALEIPTQADGCDTSEKNVCISCGNCRTDSVSNVLNEALKSLREIEDNLKELIKKNKEK